MLPRVWVKPCGRERGPPMENHGLGGEGCRRGACLGQGKATTRYAARSLQGEGSGDSPQGFGSSASPKRGPAPTAKGHRSPPAPAHPFPGAKRDPRGQGEAAGAPRAEQEAPGGTRSCRSAVRERVIWQDRHPVHRVRLRNDRSRSQHGPG